MTRIRDRLALFAIRHSKFIEHHSTFDIAVPVGSTTVKVPIIQGVGLRNIEMHEPGVEKIIGSVLNRRPGAFIDVGANIGQTLLKVLKHDRDRQYMGFDVHSFCCAYVERLIEVNKLSHCCILPIGLSDKSKVAALHHNGPHDPSASVVEHFRAKQFYRDKKWAWVERGDDIIRQLRLSPICAIKIDVEGGEGSVLLGFLDTVLTYKPFIIVENLPISHIASDPAINPLERDHIVSCRNSNLMQIEEFFAKTSYISYRILEDGDLQKIKDFDMERFDLDKCNYLLIPPNEANLAGWAR